MLNLTDLQKKVLLFIADYTEQNKYPPLTKEISAHFGWGSKTAAANHLKALRKKGRISWISGSGRTITILP